jgi:hypothetical protein
MRRRFRVALDRAFVAYEAKYGERHRLDTRERPFLVTSTAEQDAWVAEVIAARNERRPVPPPQP